MQSNNEDNIQYKESIDEVKDIISKIEKEKKDKSSCDNLQFIEKTEEISQTNIIILNIVINYYYLAILTTCIIREEKIFEKEDTKVFEKENVYEKEAVYEKEDFFELFLKPNYKVRKKKTIIQDLSSEQLILFSKDNLNVKYHLTCKNVWIVNKSRSLKVPNSFRVLNLFKKYTVLGISNQMKYIGFDIILTWIPMVFCLWY